MNSFQSVRLALRSTTEMPVLPYAVENGVQWLTRVWLYFRVLNYTSSFARQQRNLEQRNALVYGIALQCGSEYIPGGSAALNVVLIGKCATEVFTTYADLHRACKHLNNTVKWRYPVCYSIQRQEAMRYYAAPSWHLYANIHITQCSQYLFKTAIATFRVFAEIFKLSMELVEICLLINNDSEVRRFACIDVMAKWEKQSASSSSQPVSASEDHVRTGIHFVQQIEGFDKNYLTDAMQFFQQHTKYATMAHGLLGKVQKIGTHTLDSIVVPGKITSVSFKFRQPPAVYRERFPAWGGQEVPVASQLTVTERIKSVMGWMWRTQ